VKVFVIARKAFIRTGVMAETEEEALKTFAEMEEAGDVLDAEDLQISFGDGTPWVDDEFEAPA
jgi:hypothetical protein